MEDILSQLQATQKPVYVSTPGDDKVLLKGRVSKVIWPFKKLFRVSIEEHCQSNVKIKFNEFVKISYKFEEEELATVARVLAKTPNAKGIICMAQSRPERSAPDIRPRALEGGVQIDCMFAESNKIERAKVSALSKSGLDITLPGTWDSLKLSRAERIREASLEISTPDWNSNARVRLCLQKVVESEKYDGKNSPGKVAKTRQTTLTYGFVETASSELDKVYKAL